MRSLVVGFWELIYVQPDEVATALQLAMLLEVSAYPKPGNVHRTRDFEDTRFEHFLASASALYSIWRMGAQRGSLAIRNRRLMYGDLILRGCREMLRWQRGGNTSLGVILLLTPISIAAGLTNRRPRSDVSTLRKALSMVLKSGTPWDTAYIYRAIREVSPGGVGRTKELDVMDEDSQVKILEEGVTSLRVFEESAFRDSIAREWVTNFSITFTIGYPAFMEELESCGDVNVATVDTFLRILAEVPDTLIARKVNPEAALKVSRMAERIVKEGGLKTPKGLRMARRFDNLLRGKGNMFNPGTTADLTCSSISIALLAGFKP